MTPPRREKPDKIHNMDFNINRLGSQAINLIDFAIVRLAIREKLGLYARQLSIRKPCYLAPNFE